MANILDKLGDTDLNNPFEKKKTDGNDAVVNYASASLPNTQLPPVRNASDLNSAGANIHDTTGINIIPEDKMKQWMDIAYRTPPVTHGIRKMSEDALIDMVVEQLLGRDKDERNRILEKIKQRIAD